MKYLIPILVMLFIVGVSVFTINDNCKEAQVRETREHHVVMYYMNQLGPKHPDTVKIVVEYTRLRDYRIDTCSILGDGSNPNLFKDKEK